jgi:hypothetical protein
MVQVNMIRVFKRKITQDGRYTFVNKCSGFGLAVKEVGSILSSVKTSCQNMELCSAILIFIILKSCK